MCEGDRSSIKFTGGDAEFRAAALQKAAEAAAKQKNGQEVPGKTPEEEPVLRVVSEKRPLLSYIKGFPGLSRLFGVR